jgi:hypothetical protein
VGSLLYAELVAKPIERSCLCPRPSQGPARSREPRRYRRGEGAGGQRRPQAIAAQRFNDGQMTSRGPRRLQRMKNKKGKGLNVDNDEQQLLMFGSLGTAQNAAVQKYLNDNKVPQLSLATGATRFTLPARPPSDISTLHRPRHLNLVATFVSVSASA